MMKNVLYVSEDEDDEFKYKHIKNEVLQSGLSLNNEEEE